jgi:hypothetical protein
MKTLIIRPGLTGAHLLRHESPAITQTTEQKIRVAADQTADWVFVACGYEQLALEALSKDDLSPPALERLGAAGRQISDFYTLSCSAVPADAL